MSEDWTIAKMRKHYNVTPRALRFYEAKELLIPDRVGSRRVYTPQQRKRLEQIFLGKSLGMRLEQVRVALIEGKGVLKVSPDLIETLHFEAKANLDTCARRLAAINDLRKAAV